MNPEMEPRRGQPIERSERRDPQIQHLVPEAEVGAIKDRWDQIKASFVDDPRGAVRQADRLVGDTVEVVNQAVTRKRAKVSASIGQGEDGPNTEELRRALRAYQDIIARILA